MSTKSNGFQAALMGVAVMMLAASASQSQAAPPPKPIAGKTVHFPHGYWAAAPQLGPDGKVRQCVLIALRPRKGPGDGIRTMLGLNIGRGAGLAFTILDDQVPSEDVLDDQGEIVIDGGHPFPAVGFAIAPHAFVLHPGNAAAVLAALAQAKTLTLRSAGGGIDTGPMTLDLPHDALAWLTRCGKAFHIAIDRPTDPNAPALPVPRPLSPEIAAGGWTRAGPAGIEDKQKISGWDASELRGGNGRVSICLIRRHYVTGSEPDARRLATFLSVSGSKGMVLVLQDSNLKLAPGQPVEATLTINGKPFTGFTARMIDKGQIGLFPQHGADLARALEHATRFAFKSKVVGFEAPVQDGVVPWLRACARRHGFRFEP